MKLTEEFDSEQSRLVRFRNRACQSGGEGIRPNRDGVSLVTTVAAWEDHALQTRFAVEIASLSPWIRCEPPSGRWSSHRHPTTFGTRSSKMGTSSSGGRAPQWLIAAGADSATGGRVPHLVPEWWVSFCWCEAGTHIHVLLSRVSTAPFM